MRTPIALAALATLMAAGTAHAAQITWTTGPSFGGPDGHLGILTNGTLVEAIDHERGQLAEARLLGTVVDTSDLPAAALRNWIKDFVSVDATKLTLLFESFGYKHGVPLDADLVFDVRCLANPHYEPELAPQTGRDPGVVAFLEALPEVERMYGDIYHFVASWLPDYARDNRNYLTVAIGCTGGRHRSVYLVERLARAFAPRYQVLRRHRELA